MTTKQELDKLAAECEACIGRDQGSIEEHMAKCPKCQEKEEKAQQYAKAHQMASSLAAMPYNERKKKFMELVSSLHDMPDDKLRQVMTDFGDALGELPFSDHVKVVEARMDVVMKLPRDMREMMLNFTKEITALWPQERKTREKEAILVATNDYPFFKRAVIRRMVTQVLG